MCTTSMSETQHNNITNYILTLTIPVSSQQLSRLQEKIEFVYLQSQYTKIYLNSSIQPNGAFTVLTYLELETTTLKNYSSLLYSFECYSNQMVVYTAMGKLGTEFHHGAERNWSYLGFLSSVSIQCWNDFLFGTFCDLMLNQEFYNCQQL